MNNWIKVTDFHTKRRMAVNTDLITCVLENDQDNIQKGKAVRMDFSDGTFIECYENFDEIGAMIR